MDTMIISSMIDALLGAGSTTPAERRRLTIGLLNTHFYRVVIDTGVKRYPVDDRTAGDVSLQRGESQMIALRRREIDLAAGSLHGGGEIKVAGAVIRRRSIGNVLRQ
jgi:Flp pilus assembly secretin CpaC